MNGARSELQSEIKTLARWLSIAFSIFLCTSVTARADSILYGVNFSNQLLQINPATGASTMVGPLDSTMSAFGIANRNGQLYVYDQVADVIRRIDPATGHTVQTINIGVPNLLGEGDLTFDATGQGYLIAADGRFYSFDVVTGTSTLISSSLPFNIDGLSFVNGVLYGFTDVTSHNWLTINPSTGDFTVIGPFAPLGNLGGLAFDSSSGVLYAALGGTGNGLYTVNPVTGATSLIGPITSGDVSGIAFLTAMPEPGTLTLMLVGVSAAAIVSRMNRKTLRGR
jgi:hypothetical protein